MLASLSIAVFARGLPVPALVAGLALVLALGAVATTTTGRTPFRAAIAIALVDVVLLLWASSA